MNPNKVERVVKRYREFSTFVGIRESEAEQKSRRRLKIPEKVKHAVS